jgi:hypothetical protein
VVCVGAIEKCDCVVFRGAGFCVVGDQGLAGCPVQSHALVAQREVAHFGVVEGFMSSGMAMYVVAAPQAGELRALEDQLADDRSQIGCVRLEAGERSQVGDANPELAFPVLEQSPSCGVQKGVTPNVALRNGASRRGRRAASSRPDSRPGGLRCGPRRAPGWDEGCRAGFGPRGRRPGSVPAGIRRLAERRALQVSGDARARRAPSVTRGRGRRSPRGWAGFPCPVQAGRSSRC